MSSNNSAQLDHYALQQKGRSYSNRITRSRSTTRQTVMKPSVANTSTADTDECGDEELPSHLRTPKQMASEQEYARPAANDSPGLFKSLTNFLIGSSSTDSEQRPRRPDESSHAKQSQEQLRARRTTGKQISNGGTAQEDKLMQKFNQVMNQKQAEWQTKERELQHHLGHTQHQNERLENEIQQLRDELENRTHKMEIKVQEAMSEKKAVEADYNLFVRQKQEENFSKMDSWLPVEGSKVIHDLERLKKDMRAFGKGMSSKDLSVFQRLDEADRVYVMAKLAEVCVLRNGEIPEELTSTKSPALLLNALLAHHVCNTLFRNPFFFLESGLGDAFPQSGLEKGLNEIYSRMQQGKCILVLKSYFCKMTDRGNTANEEEAHIWRSQTLRVLQPQLRNDTTSQGRDLHRWTSELISKVASLEATNFFEGPARHLISDESRANALGKLQNIYRTAANISYMMWTRRSIMRCFTLKDLSQPAFDPESKEFIPHSSVKVDAFEDQLKGRPITLIIHPLLLLYGTNDAKDYHQGSVWAPAEVWLDSRKPT